jgi:hypothetical protein
VTDEREPTVEGTAQESLSLAERLARAYYDWLHDDQRHREKRFEPVGMVLFAIVSGVSVAVPTSDDLVPAQGAGASSSMSRHSIST